MPTFDIITAVDNSGNPAESAVFDFVADETSAPLPITDLQGIPLAELKSSINGFLPRFKTATATRGYLRNRASGWHQQALSLEAADGAKDAAAARVAAEAAAQAAQDSAAAAAQILANSIGAVGMSIAGWTYRDSLGGYPDLDPTPPVGLALLIVAGPTSPSPAQTAVATSGAWASVAKVYIVATNMGA